VPERVPVAIAPRHGRSATTADWASTPLSQQSAFDQSPAKFGGNEPSLRDLLETYGKSALVLKKMVI